MWNCLSNVLACVNIRQRNIRNKHYFKCLLWCDGLHTAPARQHARRLNVNAAQLSYAEGTDSITSVVLEMFRSHYFSALNPSGGAVTGHLCVLTGAAGGRGDQVSARTHLPRLSISAPRGRSLAPRVLSSKLRGGFTITP